MIRTIFSIILIGGNDPLRDGKVFTQKGSFLFKKSSGNSAQTTALKETSMNRIFYKVSIFEGTKY
jgi:hypothetical protein